MQKFTKEQINRIIKDKKLFRDIIAYTWGDIFVQMEELQIFPEKKILIDLEEASAFPFLFKNYHLDDFELVNLKNKVRVFRETIPLKEYNLPDMDIKVEDIEDNNEIDSFRNLANLIKAYKEETPIVYLNEHNLSLLEEMLKSGCSFNYSNLTNYNSFAYSNISWVSKVLANSNIDDIENISDELCVALHDIVLTFSPNSEWEKSRYYQRFIELSDNVVLEDLKKAMNFGVLENKLILDAMKKIHHLMKNRLISEGEDVDIIIEEDVDFLKSKLNQETINEIKKLVENYFIGLWDLDDFKNEKIRFIKNAFYKDYIQNIEIISDKMPRECLSFFNEDLALDFFKNRPAGFFDGASTNTVSLSKTSALIVLRLLTLAINSKKEKGFNPSEFAWAVLSNVTGVDPVLKKEIGNTAISVIENFKDDDLIENINFINLFSKKKMEQSFDFRNAIFDFLLTKEISLPKAILILSKDIEWIDNKELQDKIMQLHPNDINILKELITPLMSSIEIDFNGNAEAKPYNVKNFLNKPHRLIGTDLFESFLKSPLMFNELLSVDYKLEDIENLVLLSSNSDEDVNKLIKDLLWHVLEKKPELIPFETDNINVLNGLRCDDRLNSLLDTKYKKMSYKSFLNKIEMIDNTKNELSSFINAQKMACLPGYKISSKIEYKSFEKVIKSLEREINMQSKENYLSHIHLLIEGKLWEKVNMPDSINRDIRGELLKSDKYSMSLFLSYLKKQDIDSLKKISSELFLKINEGFQDKEILNKALILADFSFSTKKVNVDFSNMKINDNLKEYFIHLLIDDFPHLFVVDTVFSLTKDLTAKGRCDLFELGLASAKDSFISNVNDLSNKFGKNLENDEDLIKEFKGRNLTCFQKLMVPLIFKQTKFKYSKDDFEDMIKMVGCDFPLKEIEGTEQIIVNGSNTAFIFPEIFNRNFLKENIKDYTKISNLSINFKEPLWSLSTLKMSSKHLNESVCIENINKSDSYFNAFEIALNNNLNELNWNDVLPINDYNFSDFMSFISLKKVDLDNLSVVNTNFNIDINKVSKHVECLIEAAFLKDGLSNSNKDVLVNSIKAFHLSKSLLGDDSAYSLLGDVFKSNAVLNALDIYSKNNLIQTVFTSFDEKCLLSDDKEQSYDFKI